MLTSSVELLNSITSNTECACIGRVAVVTYTGAGSGGPVWVKVQGKFLLCPSLYYGESPLTELKHSNILINLAFALMYLFELCFF